MASILLVDDDAAVLESMMRGLALEGFQVLTASDGAMALSVLRSNPVDLIVSDIRMPGMNGYQFFERVRKEPEWAAIPFLFLTVRILDSDVRYGKELGVDDYLAKPFVLEDLLSAVRGKLRRAGQLAHLTGNAAPEAPKPSCILVAGRLRVDTTQHRVWLDDIGIELSRSEFKVLECLMRRPGEAVSAQDLVQATHGLETDEVEAGSLVRPLIRALRRKLGYAVGEMGCIENVRGVGYRLVP